MGEFFIFIVLMFMTACLFGIGHELSKLNARQDRIVGVLELIAKIANIKRGE